MIRLIVIMKMFVIIKGGEGGGDGFCIFIYVLLNLLIMLIMLFKWEFVIKCKIVELLWLIMIFFELWKERF